MIQALAKAFGVSEIKIRQMAGLMPTAEDMEFNPEAEELNHIFNKLDKEGQERLLHAGRYELELWEKRGNGRLS